MQVKLALVTGENQLPAMKTGEATMLVLHRAERTVLGHYYNDGFVRDHHPFITCPDVETAKNVAAKLSDLIIVQNRYLDDDWRVVLVINPIACTCGNKPHEQADRELFEALKSALAE